MFATTIHYSPLTMQEDGPQPSHRDPSSVRHAYTVVLVFLMNAVTLAIVLLSWQHRQMVVAHQEVVPSQPAVGTPLYAAHPYDPVLSTLRCLTPETGLLTADDLERLNAPVLAEIDLQLQPKMCGQSRIHPIVFGVPSENIISCATEKHRDYASVIAGHTETYTFGSQHEAEYTHAYRISRLVHTKKKSGFDCTRHWEILAAGSVPFFVDIVTAPQHTLAYLPRSLTLEARALAGVNFDPRSERATIDHSLFDERRYVQLQQQLLDLTRRRFTTEAIVHDMLRRVGRSAADVRRVLLLGCERDPLYVDYMDLYQTHGWVRVFGERATVYAPHPSMYRWSDTKEVVPYDDASLATMYGQRPYGAGFFFARRLYDQRERLENDRHFYSLEPSRQMLQEMISQHEFDLVVYTCYHRGMPFRDAVFHAYNESEILVVDGNDEAPSSSGERREVATKSTFFMREIGDDCSRI